MGLIDGERMRAVASLSHPLQRLLLLGLSTLSLVAMAQPLLVPMQPALPVLPAELNLGQGWQRQPESTAPAPRPVHVFGSKAALGESLRFSGPGGQWLILTPLASWSQPGLELGKATEGVPDLMLAAPRLRTLADGRSEIASGGRPMRFQSCLTPRADLAHSRKNLELRTARPEPGSLLKLVNTVRPEPRGSFACLLITTTSTGVFSGTPTSRHQLQQLAAAVRWPPLPPDTQSP